MRHHTSVKEREEKEREAAEAEARRQRDERAEAEYLRHATVCRVEQRIREIHDLMQPGTQQ